MKKRGFSLLEMLVVIAVIAVMAMMAGPALYRLVPIQRLRGETQNIAAFMRQARLKAASSQKPVRVVLNCAGRPGRPCRLDMAAPIYEEDNGKVEVVGWAGIPDSGHELARQVFARSEEAPPTGFPDGVYWIIFMPSGRTFSFSCPQPNPPCLQPYSLDFHADDLRGRNGPGWRLAVENASGRVAFTPIRP